MKAEIKDKEKIVHAALRAAGYSIDTIAVEVFLNIIDYIREVRPDPTLKDIIQLTSLTKELFKPETDQP